MKLNKEVKKETVFNIFAICIYSVITLIIVLEHEPWRDEVQAWLIARDLPIIDIFRQMKYEGHPCLWHLILAPFAKMGLPIVTLNIISWIIMVASAGLIMSKAPFKKITKIAILISGPFLYDFVAISRVYSLICFLMILLAVLYNKKEEHPYLYAMLLALMINTHVIMVFVVAILCWEFYIREFISLIIKKKKIQKHIIYSFLIVIMGGTIMIATIATSLNSNKENNTNQEYNISTSIINYIETEESFVLGTKDNVVNRVITIAILVVVPLFILKQKKSYFLYYGNLMYQALIFVFIYQMTTQTLMTMYPVIVFVAWTEYLESNRRKKIDFWICIFTLIGLISTMSMIYSDFRYSYSGSKEMGEYIDSNLEERAVIISPSDATTTPITIYAPHQIFINPKTKKQITFITWNDERKGETTELDVHQTIVKTPQKSIYLLINNSVNARKIEKKMIDKNIINFVYRTERTMVSSEEYKLYRIEL